VAPTSVASRQAGTRSPSVGEVPARHAHSSLLETLQRVIERTYDLDTGVTDIGRFVIGDQGFRALYGRWHDAGLIRETVADPPTVAGSASAVMPVSEATAAGSASGTARTLVREQDGGLALSIYYPDALVRCLEGNDPTRRLDDGNVDSFNTLVEELDHFLVIADRFRSQGVVSLMDLELHANVTKYLVLKMFVGKLRRASRLAPVDAAWVRQQIFDRGEFVAEDPNVRARYREASRLAARYVGALDGLAPAPRVAALRRFHRMPPQAKVAHINAVS